MARKYGNKMTKRRKAGKVTKIQDTCLTGTTMGGIGASTFQEYYINAPHILSMLNRKAFHQVNSDGSIKNYGLQIEVLNMVNATSYIYTAPHGYVTELATKAWHQARKDRYEDAGFKLSDLGYGARMRFALDKDMADTNQSTGAYMIGPDHLSDNIQNKGEWDWSEIIITPPVIDDNAGRDIHANDMTDSFLLHLCGDHTTETVAAYKYTHVGMLQSWTENSRGWSEPDAEEVFQPENPLAFARMSESSTFTLTTEVSDEQKQSPPYSNADDDDTDSPFARLVLAGQIESEFPNPATNDDITVAPGGVAKILIMNNTAEAAYPHIALRIFEL